MPIIDVQRRLAEAGRIRAGQQVRTGGTRKDGRPSTRPEKLDTWRLTSRNERALRAVAARVGGTVQRWEEAPTGDQFELITGTNELDVVLPPEQVAFSQWYELWSAGGCVRRCDGVTEQIGDWPCQCDPDKRECTPHTRLSVMLAGAPTTGLWRVDTQGHYAKTELLGAMDLARLLAESTGRAVLPAKLRLEHRQVVRDGKTRQFVVPVLDFTVDMAALAEGVPQVHALGDGEAGPVTALPSPVTPVPRAGVPSVAEQIAAAGSPPAGRRAAPTLPPTGRQPRTAQEAAGSAVPLPAADPAAHHPALGSEAPVPAWCADLHRRRSAIGLDDAQFDAVVSHVTGGRTTSTRELRPRQAREVNDLLSEIEAGRSVIVDTPDGWVLRSGGAS